MNSFGNIIKNKIISSDYESALNEKCLLSGFEKSYGDTCISSSSKQITTRKWSKFISWSSQKISLESGVSIDRILSTFVSKGHFLPVVPGTKYISVGGAIANDIHGKSHHKDGSFGHHVESFTLLRSDGKRIKCSPDQNADYFKATIGGLGLTGAIESVDLRLQKIPSSYLKCENIKFKNLDEFFDLDNEYKNASHTVSWLNCSSQDGCGIYMLGDWIQGKEFKLHRNSKMSVPFNAPNWLINSHFIKTFNFLYSSKQVRKKRSFVQHYDSFFFPLDFISNWNRLYGNRGFYQYQFVLPLENSRNGMKDIFKVIRASGMASFLNVLKRFGDKKSLGLMSFCREGYTLAVDFPNLGESLLKLFDRLDDMVCEMGGRVYLAKDARLKRKHFLKMYGENLNEFLKYKDPKIASLAWERYMGKNR